jgi:hypothetical protein
MLVTVILLVAAYTAVIVYQVVNLKKLTAETNLRQKEAIAVISGKAPHMLIIKAFCGLSMRFRHFMQIGRNACKISLKSDSAGVFR